MKQVSYYFSGSKDFETDRIPLYPEEIGGAVYEALSAAIYWKKAAVGCGAFSFTVSNDDENTSEINTAAIDSADNSHSVLIFRLSGIAADSLKIKYSVNTPNSAEIGIVTAYKKIV